MPRIQLSRLHPVFVCTMCSPAASCILVCLLRNLELMCVNNLNIVMPMIALLATVSLIIGVLMRVCDCFCFYMASMCATSRLHLCLRGYVCRMYARVRVEVRLCVSGHTRA